MTAVATCPHCAATDWRDLGTFEKHQPFRVERELQCVVCGHRRQEMVVAPRREDLKQKDHTICFETCRTGKKRYPSKRDASRAKNARLRSFRNRPAYLRAYPCPDCQGWHLTHRVGGEA